MSGFHTHSILVHNRPNRLSLAMRMTSFIFRPSESILAPASTVSLHVPVRRGDHHREAWHLRFSWPLPPGIAANALSRRRRMPSNAPSPMTQLNETPLELAPLRRALVEIRHSPDRSTTSSISAPTAER